MAISFALTTPVGRAGGWLLLPLTLQAGPALLGFYVFGWDVPLGGTGRLGPGTKLWLLLALLWSYALLDWVFNRAFILSIISFALVFGRLAVGIPVIAVLVGGSAWACQGLGASSRQNQIGTFLFLAHSLAACLIIVFSCIMIPYI
jgi:hypothetical protein